MALLMPLDAGTDQPFALEQLRNGRRVQPTHLAQESGALEQLHIFGRVKAVLADCAVGPGEAQTLPGADHRRRNAHQASHIADFQVSFWVGGLHSRDYAPMSLPGLITA